MRVRHFETDLSCRNGPAVLPSPRTSCTASQSAPRPLRAPSLWGTSWRKVTGRRNKGKARAKKKSKRSAQLVYVDVAAAVHAQSQGNDRMCGSTNGSATSEWGRGRDLICCVYWVLRSGVRFRMTSISIRFMTGYSEEALHCSLHKNRDL